MRADLDRYDDDGEPLRLEGTVTDRACRPLAGAVVVIWHADPADGYDMDSPERRYYGQVAADGQGALRLHHVDARALPQRRHLPPGAPPREGLCRGGRAADHAALF